ncbi:MAG TPA: AAA family ATPase [Verrucomicrobiae bacterium]
MNSDHLPPHDLQAEAGALGCVLLANGDVNDMIRLLAAEFFYDARHRIVLKAVKSLQTEGKPIDVPTVAIRLREMGETTAAEYAPELPDKTPSSANFPAFLEVLQDRATRRALLRDSAELAELANNSAMPRATLAAAARKLGETYSAVAGNGGLTIRTPDELLAMVFDDSDCVLGDRLIAVGQSCSIIGQAGIGKSRIGMQAAACCITGRPFLGIDTHAPKLSWLVLQVENTNRRLRDDLAALRKWCGADWPRVNAQLLIHTLEGEADTFVSLDSERNVVRIAETIQRHNPGAVIWDSLYNFGIGDLNTDTDMAATLAAVSRLTRQGRPDRIPLVFHHALTGKHGASRAVGYERAGFARNSKVLLAWSRAQINLSPGSPDNNDLLVVSCGKNSNGREFSKFAARLNPATMLYEVDPSFDFGAWESALSGRTNSQPLITPDRTRELCRALMSKADLAHTIREDCGCARPVAYRYIKRAEQARKIKWNSSNETYSPK